LSKRDATFNALADGTRRAILDLLRRSESMTAGAIAASFATISRPAVSRHLRVLRDAGLVQAREDGREWHYRLDIAPLRDVQEAWIAPFLTLGETSLRRLKQRAESEKHERRRGSKRETPTARRKGVARRR
jgi:DNA-binding transcriptional ArsR family regulator